MTKNTKNGGVNMSSNQHEKKKKKIKTSNFGRGLASGIVLGLIFSILYLKFNYKLPSFLRLGEQIKSGLSTAASSLLVNEGRFGELQRMIAIKIQGDPDYYVKIDNAVDNFMTEEVIWREIIKSRLNQLQRKIKTYKETAQKYSKKYPSLKKSFSHLINELPEMTAKEGVLVSNYIKTRFPGLTDKEITEEILRISKGELLEMPQGRASRVVFGTRSEGDIRIEIFDKSSKKIKTLIDAHNLPVGKYRVYWDFTDDKGQKVPLYDSYHYKLYKNNVETKSKVIPQPWFVRD